MATKKAGATAPPTQASDAQPAAVAPAANTVVSTPAAGSTGTPVAKVDSDRQARWAEFLKGARAQREDPTVFDAQQAAGEFDKIPDSFV